MTQQIQTRPYAYWSLSVASLSGFLQSYVVCAIAGALPFLVEEFQLSSSQQGLAASTILLGALVGSSAVGSLADEWGRKRCFQIAALLFLLTSLAIPLVHSFYAFLSIRFLTGIAAGMTAILIPLYLAEIALPSKRGIFVTCYQFSATLGTLGAYFANFLLTSSGNWRAMLSFALFPAAFQLLALFFFSESPKWLIGQGNAKAGEAIFRRLYKEWPLSPPQEQSEGVGSWANLKQPIFRFVLLLGALLSVFQQLSGINGIVYFTPRIFQEAGFCDHKNAMFQTLLVGIVNTAATLFSFFLIDKKGRRKLLLWSQAALLGSLALIVLAFATKNAFLDLFALVGLLLYIGSYSLGVGPVTWVLISEIYPLSIRAKAIAVMTLLSWISSYLVVLTFPPLIHGLGASWTFSLYAFFSTCAFVAIWLWIPETKGKSLEQIEMSLLKKGPL